MATGLGRSLWAANQPPAWFRCRHMGQPAWRSILCRAWPPGSSPPQDTRTCATTASPNPTQTWPHLAATPQHWVLGGTSPCPAGLKLLPSGSPEPATRLAGCCGGHHHLGELQLEHTRGPQPAQSPEQQHASCTGAGMRQGGLVPQQDGISAQTPSWRASCSLGELGEPRRGRATKKRQFWSLSSPQQH